MGYHSCQCLPSTFSSVVHHSMVTFHISKWVVNWNRKAVGEQWWYEWVGFGETVSSGHSSSAWEDNYFSLPGTHPLSNTEFEAKESVDWKWRNGCGRTEVRLVCSLVHLAPKLALTQTGWMELVCIVTFTIYGLPLNLEEFTIWMEIEERTLRLVKFFHLAEGSALGRKWRG